MEQSTLTLIKQLDFPTPLDTSFLNFFMRSECLQDKNTVYNKIPIHYKYKQENYSTSTK